MNNQQRRMHRMGEALLKHWTSYRSLVIRDDAHPDTNYVTITDPTREGDTFELEASMAEEILGWKDRA